MPYHIFSLPAAADVLISVLQAKNIRRFRDFYTIWRTLSISLEEQYPSKSNMPAVGPSVLR